MQLGMIGLGRMGGNMVQRLIAGGQRCAVYDVDPGAVAQAAAHGAVACAGLHDLVQALRPPRVLWIMLPAAIVDDILDELTPLLREGDVVIDGGNSSWRDDVRRAAELTPLGIEYMDVGTSGGVRGRDRGYCLMVGGSEAGFRLIEPVLLALAPGMAAAAPTPGRPVGGSAEQGYLHCGPAGAGHFVKMVHNAIEYGIMAAYAEGFNLLHQAGRGLDDPPTPPDDVPLAYPEHYRYDFPVPEIAELWRRGSVIGSWLLDLTAQALQQDPQLQKYAGRVSDSGEGRWAMGAAMELGVPVPVLGASLFSRFESRERASFAMKTLSAMREQFGGHIEAAGSAPAHSPKPPESRS